MAQKSQHAEHWTIHGLRQYRRLSYNCLLLPIDIHLTFYSKEFCQGFREIVWPHSRSYTKRSLAYLIFNNLSSYIREHFVLYIVASTTWGEECLAIGMKFGTGCEASANSLGVMVALPFTQTLSYESFPEKKVAARSILLISFYKISLGSLWKIVRWKKSNSIAQFIISVWLSKIWNAVLFGVIKVVQNSI